VTFNNEFINFSVNNFLDWTFQSGEGRKKAPTKNTLLVEFKKLHA